MVFGVDEVILSAVIETFGMILSSLITAVVGGYFAYRWLKQQKLQENLEQAVNDIEFMLELEKIYVDMANK